MQTALFVFGTRPEVIKLAPLIYYFRENPSLGIIPCLCATSQQRELQDQMLSLFELKADFDLDMMKPNQNLHYLTGELLQRLNPVFEKASPAITIVQGDTTSTFVGALASFYHKTPIAHVEAGLRTNKPYSPFPEEINRKLTADLATLHFAPTRLCQQHLLDENISESAIHVVGNTVIDSLLWMQKNKERFDKELRLIPDPVYRLISDKRPYALITGHRRESFGEGFLAICKAIATLADRYPDFSFVYPVHLNPNVQAPVQSILSKKPNVHLIAPQSYPCFFALLDQCYFVLTDSGGVQEEAPSLGKPVLVMRETSERVEGINAGTAKLVGAHFEQIVTAASALIDNKQAHAAMANAINPYGDGNSSEKIAEIIAKHIA